MPLNALDVADMVASTLPDLGRNKFQNVAQNLVSYEVFTKWFTQDRVVFTDGTSIQSTLMNRLSGNAAHVGLMHVDNTNIVDLVDQLAVPWRHAQTFWSFNFQMGLMNKGASMIYNVVAPRRAAAMIDLVEELENKAWAAPNAANKTDPYGIPYWVVKNSSTGFNGGLPSDHATVGGVSLTDTPTFKNYTMTHSAISKNDLIKKMRTAKRACNFMSPVDIRDYRNGKGMQYRIYVNENTISGLEDVGESQNENLGRDIASVDGIDLSFRGHPIRYIPKLNDDTQDPVYGIDHSVFMPVCLKGDYLRESSPIMAPNQHNWFNVFVDLTYNYLCVDRRRNFVSYLV